MLLTDVWPVYLLIGVQPKPGFGHVEVRPWVKFSTFGPGETLDLYAYGPKNFPPGIFIPFWRPTAGNYKSVFLTVVRPNGASDRCVTKIYVLSFWPLCDQERPQKSATNEWRVKENFKKKNWGKYKEISKLFWENFRKQWRNCRVIFKSFRIVVGKISQTSEILVEVRESFGRKPEEFVKNFLRNFYRRIWNNFAKNFKIYYQNFRKIVKKFRNRFIKVL